MKSFVVSQPKLHRRKPLPWDVRRSLKKDELPYLMSSKNLTLDLDIKINPTPRIVSPPSNPMDSLLAAANICDSNPPFKINNISPIVIQNCNQLTKAKSLQSLCSKFSIAC